MLLPAGLSPDDNSSGMSALPVVIFPKVASRLPYENGFFSNFTGKPSRRGSYALGENIAAKKGT